MSGLLSLQKLKPKTIAVAGDLILDRYTYGYAQRVSPEAPVPILSVISEEKKAGGAGNVALNLASLGMNVKLLGRVGADQAGVDLVYHLTQAGIDCSACFKEASYPTSVKTRLIASSQQLLRVDQESVDSLELDTEQRLIDCMDEWLQGVELLAISDYAKGLLTERLLENLIAKAKLKKILVIIDPKGADFRKYRGADVIKPNFHEALAAVPPSERTLEKAASWMLDHLAIKNVIITRSEQGISVFSKERIEHFPVQHQRQVLDVTGAGDTVLACIAASLASHVSISEAIALANIAASVAIERVGCAQVSFDDIAKRLLDQNPTGKILSWKSFSTVHSALKKNLVQCFALQASKDMHIEKLKELRKKAASLPVSTIKIAFFSDHNPDEHILELVSGLDAISFVVYGAEPEKLADLNLCLV